MATRTAKVTSEKITGALNKYYKDSTPLIKLTNGQYRGIEEQYSQARKSLRT